MPSQAKWQGKKEKFQAALSCIGLRYSYKTWVKMIKTWVQPNTTATLNVWKMSPDEDTTSEAHHMGTISLQPLVHHDED